MALHHNPRIVTDSSLVLLLDAADPASYTSGSLTWKDLSGNNNHAALTGSFDEYYSFSDDGVNKYFLRDPSSDAATGSYWYVHPDSTITPTQNWTVGGFVNFIPGQTSNGGGWFHKSGTSDERGIHIEAISNNFRINGASNWSDINVGLTSYHNKWTYFTVTYDSAGTYGTDTGNLSLYINSSHIYTESTFIPAADNGTYGITLGKRNGHKHHHTDGKISNYHYYKRALSENEVLQNYNALRTRYGL